jgi:hypothetical protein
MGGILSSRWWYTATRSTTNQYTKLDIRGQQAVKNASTVTVRSRSGEQVIGVTWTPCHYGGERPWWRCPVCGRRAAVLYQWRVWACRRCLRLAYPSTRQDACERLDARARRLGERVGVSGARASELPSLWPRRRPRYMHRSTFRRLKEQAWVLHDMWDDAAATRLLRLMDHLMGQKRSISSLGWALLSHSSPACPLTRPVQPPRTTAPKRHRVTEKEKFLHHQQAEVRAGVWAASREQGLVFSPLSI